MSGFITSVWEKLFFILAAVVLAALVGMMIFSESGFRDWSRLREEERRIIAENHALELENLRFAQKIKRLKLDLGTIENVARHQLGMVGEDEIVFRFKKGAGEDEE